jgi:hypothetical protein
VQAVLGESVAVGVRDTGDEAAHAQPAQVVGDLCGGDCGRVNSAQFAGERAEILVGEPVGLQPEQRQGCEQGVAARLSQLQPGNAGAGFGGDRRGDGVQGVGTADRVCKLNPAPDTEVALPSPCR